VLWSLTAPSVVAAQELLTQVHVITRHGSRYPLRKDASDLSESTPGTLTAFGEKQMYDLGQWIHETYAANSTDPAAFLQSFASSSMRLESSSLERTIVSANSLALGLFAGEARDPTLESLLPVVPANVPVYTHDMVNDIYMRAFDKCPELHDRLQALYLSDEWQQLETENDQFLAQLAETTYFQPYANQNGIVPLEQIWNVYDTIFVAKTECSEGHEDLATCQSISDGVDLARNVLTDEQWVKVMDLAHQAELMKYGPKTADKLIGINLIQEIVHRMMGGGIGLNDDNGNQEIEFSLFSAHYATILGVFSALDKTFFSQEVIPHYAAALIFEVTERSDTAQRFFKLTYKGDDRPNSRAVSIDLSNICGNSLICPVSSLQQFLGAWSVERWCNECANEGANQCLTGQDGSGKEVTPPAVVNDNDDDDEYPAEFGFILGLIVGAIGVVVTFFVQRRFYKKLLEEQKNQAQNNIPPAHYDDSQMQHNNDGVNGGVGGVPLEEAPNVPPSPLPAQLVSRATSAVSSDESPATNDEVVETRLPPATQKAVVDPVDVERELI